MVERSQMGAEGVPMRLMVSHGPLPLQWRSIYLDVCSEPAIVKWRDTSGASGFPAVGKRSYLDLLPPVKPSIGLICVPVLHGAPAKESKFSY